jgi:hypothetical protein
MINYVEIRDFNTRKIIGIVDGYKSVIWAAEYFGVGTFEVYAPATARNLNLLKENRIVTRCNDVNVGIIEKIEVQTSITDGEVIIASGHFAKILLGQRIIYVKAGTYSVAPTILNGRVALAAVKLVNDNCVNSALSHRNFNAFRCASVSADLDAVILGGDGQPSKIQVTYDNLLTYSDDLLKKYGYAARVELDPDGYFSYNVYQGTDRTERLTFSREYDNLISSNYIYDLSNLKTTAIIGGQGEGLERFIAMAGNEITGYSRRELWVDDNQQAKTVKEGETERTYTDAEYNKILAADGMLKLSEHKLNESFKGEIDLTRGRLVYGRDYSLGDLIKIYDSTVNKTAICRIIKVNEVEDENGYQIAAEYETV